ncbi:DinB family protein [Paenibacillus thailandensis]|uniref:DinB family protein n=1 Tax=Paenibacillus thailandensis TaxID=393250 RepID=A0ABW5QW09_9BACL
MSKIQAYVAGWLSHREALLDLLDVVSDEQLSYKPWEKGMSFAELAQHVSGATLMFVKIVKTGSYTPSSAPPQKASSVEELRAIVKEQTEETKALLESIAPEQLDDIVDFNGMKMPGAAMLDMAKEHEIHHKGQLFTYARAAGIEKVPFFIHRSA